MGGRGTRKLERVTRKVPKLPENIKNQLLSGKGDRITAKALNLQTQKPVKLNKKARGPNKAIDVSKLNINSGNLSKKTLLRLENDLARGITRNNVDPIVVTPIKGKPGQYTVVDKKSGNQRIAYLKLAGYDGKVLVKVVSETRRGLTAKERKTRTAKKAKKAVK
jgi:hypothetical protein